MAETKQDIFQDIYRSNFQSLLTQLMDDLASLSGFTDAQKLDFVAEIIAARETYGRDASAFFLSFITAKQTIILASVDSILADEEARLQAMKDAVTAKRVILAS